ncbi:MAG TPA: hypothetical protein V6D34_09485 [Candidatus Sericytochromatia bacterium]
MVVPCPRSPSPLVPPHEKGAVSRIPDPYHPPPKGDYAGLPGNQSLGRRKAKKENATILQN